MIVKASYSATNTHLLLDPPGIYVVGVVLTSNSCGHSLLSWAILSFACFASLTASSCWVSCITNQTHLFMGTKDFYDENGDGDGDVQSSSDFSVSSSTCVENRMMKNKMIPKTVSKKVKKAIF